MLPYMKNQYYLEEKNITGNMPISDKTYRLLLSSGLTAGGLGLAWLFMKMIVPSKEQMLKVTAH